MANSHPVYDPDPSTYEPTGPLVEDLAIRAPEKVPLYGSVVSLIPLQEEHIPILWEHVGGAKNARLWRWMLSGPHLTYEAFDQAIRNDMQRNDAIFWSIALSDSSEPEESKPALSSPESGAVRIDQPPSSNKQSDRHKWKYVGQIALHRTFPAFKTTEVGYVLFGNELQRTKAATEVMYLLGEYAFGDPAAGGLGYRRWEWKCNDCNEGSRQAAARLGFKYEGTFKCHMIIKGRSRDTWWAAITKDEWEGDNEKWPRRGIREAFQLWLSPENFDGEGRQRRRLEDIRQGN